MFPLPPEQLLSLARLADYYSREVQPAASKREVLTMLIGALWRGDLKGDSGVDRLTAVRLIFEKGHDRIAFVIPGQEPPPTARERDDGNWDIILLVQVPLPNAKPESWTEETCAPAFDALARDWVFLEGDVTEPWFGAIEVTRTAFFEFLARRGPWRPSFWGEAGDKVQRTVVTSQALRPASQMHISEAVAAAYDEAVSAGRNPPNIVKLVAPVQTILNAAGLRASGKAIQEVAGAHEFAQRRRKPGATLKSERRRTGHHNK